MAPTEELSYFDGAPGSGKRVKSLASQLHDHTYGITSDPLTQFACVFSALIHDVDHPGVPNTQLIKENAKVAGFYRNKSVAEQNSVDLAWDLLQGTFWFLYIEAPLLIPRFGAYTHHDAQMIGFQT